MTVRLVLGEQDADRFDFGCSAGLEALRSLHVLAAVKRHPLHISWVLETRARLDAELKGGLEAFGFWFSERPLLVPKIWPPGMVNSWEDDLDTLRKAPVEHFAESLVHAALAERGRARHVPLARFRADVGLRERAGDNVGRTHPASVAVIGDLVADPEQVRDRFAAFLAAYWDACLAADWPSLQAHLHDEIARRFRSLARLGPARMLADLSEHITAADGAAVIRPPGARGKADPIDVALSGRDRVLLMPSHFIWPELAVTVRHDRVDDLDHDDADDVTTVGIAYTLAGMARRGRAPAPADDLLGLLRSAGDATRLQILELLARRACSTSELAGLVGLTEAAVSKHLKVLHKAGWVAPERHSYYVYYRLEPDARNRLASGLERLLEREGR